MTKKIRILIYPLLVMGLFLAVSCRDDNNDDNNGNNNNNNNNDATTFTDSRDGNVYKTVKLAIRYGWLKIKIFAKCCTCCKFYYRPVLLYLYV